MTGFLSIFKREIKGYFATPVAYVFLTIFLLLSSFQAFRNGFFLARTASLSAFFQDMPLLLLLMVPALSMRLWAEERRSKSVELLFSLPITTFQAVLGKFLAAWFVMILALVLTFPMVITVDYLGNPDWGPILTGYFACALLAGVYMAIGSLFSIITKNQVIAFILSVVICGVFLFAGSPMCLDFLAGFSNKAASILELLSFQSRFESIERGVIEFRDLGFFVILIVGFVWSSILLLEERRSA